MNKSTFEQLNVSLCTGCAACKNICPASCISMEADGEGFPYPHIDKGKCTQCGLCADVCPILNKMQSDCGQINEVYCGWSLDKDVRFTSTSGGFFSELAYALCREKGSPSIYGAGYHSPYHVCHMRIDSIDQISLLRQSKYTQSEIGDAYSLVEKDLNSGKTVLFSGVPCQIAALHSYLKQRNISTENLYSIDLICHSVNSPAAFAAYLSEIEQEYGDKAKRIWYKNKETTWPRFSTRIDFEGRNDYYLGGRYKDAYMRGFNFYNLYQRPCCSECRFKGSNYFSDITLADAWGVKTLGSIDNGVSSATIRTDKGKYLFGVASVNLYVETHPYDAVMDTSNMARTDKHSPFRDYFFNNLGNKPFSQIINDVALMTEEENLKKKEVNIIKNGNAVLDIDVSAQIYGVGTLSMNDSLPKGSATECWLIMERNTKLFVKDNFRLKPGTTVKVFKGGSLTLGSGYANHGVRISCENRISIGAAVYIGLDTLIFDSDFHDILDENFAKTNMSAPVIIEDHVWIGSRCTILKGVRIGEGAVIASNSLVNRDVPAHSLVAGTPARVIRENINWK